MARATTKAAATRSTGSTKKATTKAAAMKKTPTASAKTPAKAKASGNGLDKFLAEQLQALKDERVTYLRQAETLKAEADSLMEDRDPGDVQFDEESGEGDTLAVERERDLALSAQARAAIEEIDLAVAKVHAGSYGRCEKCGKDIPKERLKALPHAALCVTCKAGGGGLR